MISMDILISTQRPEMEECQTGLLSRPHYDARIYWTLGLPSSWIISRTKLRIFSKASVSFEFLMSLYATINIGRLYLRYTLIYLRYFSDGGTCISFNPKDDTIFLVGTESGTVYKCTTEYSSIFLETYLAHTMPLYNICWNTYIPSIFLTCAAEMIIKIWDEKST